MDAPEPAATSVPRVRSEAQGSVRNAARLLRAFGSADAELGIAELSRRVGIGKSTVHRTVTALVQERLLERGATPGRYRLGLALYELGTRVNENVDLHQAALPVLTTLRHNTGEMVHVAVLDGLEVVYVERLESHHLLPIFRTVGHRLPAHWTSSGKVLLAALPRAELERRLEGWTPLAHTPRTITHRGRLLAELDRVAAQGWAHNLEEGHLGVVSIGAPIRGPDGLVMAGLSVVASSSRMTPQVMRRLAPQVIAAAGLITRRLGHLPR